MGGRDVRRWELRGWTGGVVGRSWTRARLLSVLGDGGEKEEERVIGRREEEAAVCGRDGRGKGAVLTGRRETNGEPPRWLLSVSTARTDDDAAHLR